MQTYKGLAFVIITAGLLYTLVKRNINTIEAYYKQFINTDEQLKRSQEEFISLFNHSPIPMCIYDLDSLKILMANEKACEFYGYSNEEFLQLTLKDLRLPEDIPLMNKNVDIARKAEKYSTNMRIRHLKRNGDTAIVNVKTSAVSINGKTARLASAIDITADIELQNKLLESNAKLQLAGEIAEMGYWTNNLKTGEIQWSDEVYKIFEIEPKDINLRIEEINKYFHPDYQLVFDIAFFDAFNDQPIIEKEHRIITGKGNNKWILERKYLTRDEHGNPVKLEGIALNITNRKLYEREIWESNERFKILANATIEAIIDWDLINNTVLWGEGFHKILGYDLSKVDNNLWINNIYHEDKERVLDEFKNALRDHQKENFNSEFRFLKANGEIAYVQHKGIFVRNEEGRVTRALGAMIDYTDTLNRMQKIEHQNKALKSIAWTQSHVVRAPLANLIGLVSLLNDTKNELYVKEDIIDYINESANKLDSIIHDIVKKTTEVEDITNQD